MIFTFERYAVDVRTFRDTAVLLNDIDLAAVTGPNEITKPFMVTGVYQRAANGSWRNLLLHLLRQVRARSVERDAGRPQTEPNGNGF